MEHAPNQSTERSSNTPQRGQGDYHYIATGDVLVLGFREKNSIHIKVLRPVRSADFPLEDGTP